jgi:hypothetical protein
MRQRDAQILERARPIQWIRRRRRQRKRVPLSRNRAQHRVHESARARLARPFHQIHRIVYDRGRRHAREVEQLVRAQTQDVDHLAIETRDRPLGEMTDQMIQRAAPALHAGGDFRGERAVALVSEHRAGVGNAGGQVGSVCRNGAKDLVRRVARRRDHRAPNAVPGSSGWPARNSRAVIGRLPSAWISTMRMAPAPVCTTRSSSAAATIRPGDDRSGG